VADLAIRKWAWPSRKTWNTASSMLRPAATFATFPPEDSGSRLDLPKRETRASPERSVPMHIPRRRAGIATGLVVAFAFVLVVRPGGTEATTAVDDLLTVAAALWATGAATWRARRLRGRSRASWILLACGFGSAALGEVTWSWYELVLGQASPVPSLADLAYLSFPVLALAGLLLRPSSALLGQGRTRSLLDGLLVAGSLFNISWVTALGSAYGSQGNGWAFGVSLAYPTSDVVLVTITLVVLARAQNRHALGVLAAGLFAQALSDSAYTYFVAYGTYASGNLLDIGYLAGYLLLAEAALRDDAPDDLVRGEPPSLLSLLLPYLPSAAGVSIAVWQLHPGLSNPPVLVGTGLLVVLLIRQLLMLLDNRGLISKVLAQQAELRYQAFHDPLTSLANRALFTDRLAHAVALHRRDLRPVTVLLLDLDDFKTVNDSLGHPAGDVLLLRVAERLRGATRAGDTVARLGGDEFAVLIEDGADGRDVAARISSALDHPVQLDNREIPVGASIGIAVLDADAAPIDAAELLKRADIAMYSAKHSCKGATAMYSPGADEDATNAIDLRADLVAAVAAGDLEVHFQPIYRCDGSLLGFESLSRWTRQGNPVAPDVFISVARRSGILRALDAQVLRATAALAGALVDAPVPLLFSVNAGVGALGDPDFPASLGSLLDQHGLQPRQLVVEVPEDDLFTDPTAAGTALVRLRGCGIQLALDDFGVGWSSLARLQALPPDIVKIDRCFVTPLARRDAPTDLLAGMIDLAHRVGAFVIAEGIESPQQLAILRDLGCDAVQGFLLGRPMPAAQALQLARAVPVPGPRRASNDELVVQQP
jgi:diguanylate cyclase (GGDEF)-like protein